MQSFFSMLAYTTMLVRVWRRTPSWQSPVVKFKIFFLKIYLNLGLNLKIYKNFQSNKKNDIIVRIFYSRTIMKKILFFGIMCVMAFGFNENDENFCAEIYIDKNSKIYVKESSNAKNEACQNVMKSQIMKIFGLENKDSVPILKIYSKKDKNDTLMWIKRDDYLLDIEKMAKIKKGSIKDLKKRDIRQFETTKEAFAKLENKLLADDFDKMTQEVLMQTADKISIDISKSRNDLLYAISDIGTYYTAHEKFDNPAQMTNREQEIKVKDEICATIKFKNEREIEISTNKTGICEEFYEDFRYFDDIKEFERLIMFDKKGKIVIK